MINKPSFRFIPMITCKLKHMMKIIFTFKDNQEKPMLGEKLIAANVITKGQLDEAISEQKKTGKRLGEILVEKGYATQEQIESALK